MLMTRSPAPELGFVRNRGLERSDVDRLLADGGGGERPTPGCAPAEAGTCRGLQGASRISGSSRSTHQVASLSVCVAHSPSPSDDCLGLANARPQQGSEAAGESSELFISASVSAGPQPLAVASPDATLFGSGTFSVPSSYQAPRWCLSRGAHYLFLIPLRL